MALFNISLPAAIGIMRGLIHQLFPVEGAPAQEAGKVPTPRATPSDDELTLGSERDKQLRRLMSHYDLRRISPAEWRNLVTELRKLPEFSKEDLHQLVSITQELERLNLGPHERIDLLGWYRDRLRRLESMAISQEPLITAEKIQIRRHLSLLERLASYQSV